MRTLPDPVDEFGEVGEVRGGYVTPATVAAVEEADQSVIDAARADVNEFIPYVGRDESGLPLVQHEIHERMQWVADDCPRAIFLSFPESGKTSQLGILRLLWLIGRNPNIRIGIVSKKEGKAVEISRAIRSYVEKSPELAEVFPDLIPGDKWEEAEWTVRRTIHSRHPTVQALGLWSAVTGSRFDVLVFDDALDDENTRTPEERRKVLKRIRGTFIDRLAKGGRVLFMTNAWHPEDAAHVLEKESGWAVLRIPVLDADGVLAWPEKWQADRVDGAREDMGPLEFARAFLCRPRADGENPFDEDDIRAAQRRAEAERVDLVIRVDRVEFPWIPIYTGVDLAVTKARGSHLTSLVSLLLWPEDLSRQLLWVESGRWSSAEIRDRVLDHDRRYRPTFIVENNAAQRWIIDIILNQADLPEEERRLPEIVPFTTGRNKAHPQFGVEGVAVEFSAGKWVFPVTGNPAAVTEARELAGEMTYYVRGAHTGDRLMALWLAREGARRGALAGRREREAPSRDLDHPGGVRIVDGDEMVRDVVPHLAGMGNVLRL
jgi:hypothetical protein